MQSKKHKENELKESLRPAKEEANEEEESPEPSKEQEPVTPAPAPVAVPVPVASTSSEAKEDEEETDEGEDEDALASIEAKIAAARHRLSATHCLFCPLQSSSIDENLTHMSNIHSFFVPDADFLVDLPGLLIYLGEKVAVGNVCIYCNEKGREFRTLEAVRKHMVDKSHCKIAYDKESDKLEISDYYDFSSSYPDAFTKKKGKGKKKSSKVVVEVEEEEWEDDSDVDDNEVDEVVEQSATESEESEDDDDLDSNELTYGDSPFELVLPSGARIGHRSMKRYYDQSFLFQGGRTEEDEAGAPTGAALVRKLLADKNSALVPRKGGYGAFGTGTEVIKARNRGEAKNAGRHVREFRDQRRREDFKTKVGFIHNSQKHFRDPRTSLSSFFHSMHVLTSLYSAPIVVVFSCIWS